MSLKLGSGRKIELTVDAEDGLLNDYVRQHITWSSSDEGVLTVAEDGTLTAHTAGEATITAAFGESTVSVHVTVAEDGTGGGGGTGEGTGTGLGESTGDAAQGETPAEVPAAVEVPPAEAQAVEFPTQKLLAIRAAALSGMTHSSPDGESLAGSMAEDSTQLVVPLTEEKDWTVPVLCAALGALALGAGFELIRFRRLLKKR